MTDLTDTRRYIIAFKAGRAFRRDGTNFVDPSPEKGAVILYSGDDDLMHFIWKNRTSNEAEEDLIMFHGDATFIKVSQAPGGRTYVLKFQSSDQRHFFWMQDASDRRDEEFVRHLNRHLEAPGYVPVWNLMDEEHASGSGAGTSQSVAAPAANRTQQQATPEQLAELRRIMRGGGSATSVPQAPELALGDILTPANITPLFTSHPELVQSLFPHLPPDLPTPPSQETIQQVISSPQFRAAVRSLDQALRTGLLGGLVRGLGLPEEAGTSIEAFLRAIQEQASSGGSGESMDTD